ncbi:MAG: Rne/Rng family ribonuclease [Bacteriovoracaceae bacterium]|nr:Rne/Rng family ribonuclease [Bacteriovoracaceae bacterium]
MAKELVINNTFNECRVALLENGEIIDYLMERNLDKREHTPSVGDIYKGKVVRILPGMQSAFVDIGYTKAAFLYVDDAYIPTLEEQRDMIVRARREREAENMEKIGETIPDEFSTLSEDVNMKYRPECSIESFLKEGDEILVQVAKEPISTKGPRVTRHITVAGRYVVYMPFIEHSGVSRRIQSEEERDRLKSVLDTIRPEGRGVIGRTVAEGQPEDVLKSDYEMLVKVWNNIQETCEGKKAPKMVYKDLTFVQRVLRDITDDDVSSIIVDTKDNLDEAESFVSKYIPRLHGKVKFHKEPTPLFEKFGIDLAVQSALSNKVFLKSGGSINVDQTEALVSIDVNTGRFVGKKSLEETILITNLEAVREISYQLRLRNCGGIIIIDFIDMEKKENREQVYHTLLEALKRDRSKTNVLPISGLGLVEMTRKRTRDTLIRTMCDPCPYCEGTGSIKTTLTVCYELIRELMKFLAKVEGPKVLVYAHPEVTARLSGEDLDVVESLEDVYGKSIQIRSENNYHLEQFELFSE